MKHLTLALALTIVGSIPVFAMIQQPTAKQIFQKALRRVENQFEAGTLTQNDVDAVIGPRAEEYVDSSAVLGLVNKIKNNVLQKAEAILAQGAEANPAEKENVIAALRLVKYTGYEAGLQAARLLERLQ